MIVRLFIGFSIMLSRSGIFMLMEYKLNMDVQNKGYIMSIYSIGGVVTQLLFIPFLVSCTNLSNRSLVVCSAVVLAGCQFMLGLMTTPHSFYAVIVGLACSSSVLKVAMSNALSNAAGKNNKGEVLGVAGSVMSVCRALSPMASGVLVETYDVVVPSYVAAGSMVVVVFLAPFFVPLEEVAEHVKHTTTATTAALHLQLQTLMSSNHAKVEALEQKILLLSGKRTKTQHREDDDDQLDTTLGGLLDGDGSDDFCKIRKKEGGNRAALQLNQVLKNRAASNAVIQDMQQQELNERTEQLSKEREKKKCDDTLNKQRTVLEGLVQWGKHWLHELRFPVLIAVLYLMYFRRTRRLKRQ